MPLIYLLLAGCASEEVSTDFTYGGGGGGGASSGEEEQEDGPPDPPDEPSDESSPEHSEGVPPDCTDPAGTADADPTELAGREDCGEMIYFSDCGPCHGDSGGPNPTSNWSDFDDASLVEIILEGIMEMPPQDLTPQEVADVIEFIRQEFD